MSASNMKELSFGRQCLVRLSQRVVFGKILQLHVCGGDPVFDPAPRIIVRKKNGTTSVPRDCGSDFALKREWIDFFNDLTTIGDGVILTIEIANGLPLIHEFEGTIQL